MTRRPSIAVIVALLALAAAACQQTGLSEQDQAAIRKVHEEAMKLANVKPADYAAYVKHYYADDAEMLAPNMPPAKGAVAIQKTLESFPPMSNFAGEILEVAGAGGVAYVRGKYALTMTLPGGAPLTDSGKYVEIWKKQADGGWKVAYDTFNSDLPLSPFTVPTATMAADASPEVKALGAWAGRWEFEGSATRDPKSAPVAGGAKGTMACDWFAGGHELFCVSSGVELGKPMQGMAVHYYDKAAKGHASFGLSNSNPAVSGKVDIKPGVWVETANIVVEGKPAKIRSTTADMTAEGGTWKTEISIAGGPWTTVAEGKYWKAKQS